MPLKLIPQYLKSLINYFTVSSKDRGICKKKKKKLSLFSLLLNISEKNITQMWEMIFDNHIWQKCWPSQMVPSVINSCLINFVYILFWHSASQSCPAVVTLSEGLVLDFSCIHWKQYYRQNSSILCSYHTVPNLLFCILSLL